jgi:hypothetical protein
VKPLARCWLFALILCAVCFIPARASADASSAIGAGVAAGVAAGATSAAFDRGRGPLPTELVGRELPEWIDPLTGSASRLASSCGLTLEARLSGMPLQNFLNLTISNDTDGPIAFDSRSVTVRFGSGLSRQLSPLGGGDAEIRPGWWTHRAFAFPAKAEFEHEDRLRVEVLVAASNGELCTASVSLAHRPGAKVPERSYTAFSPLELAFGLTAHFAATGDLRRIAENTNPGFDIGFTGYPWVHHGITFEFGVEAYGRKGLPLVVPNQSTNGITGAFFMLGYSYRILPIRQLALEYNLNAGLYAFEVTSPDGNGTVASSACLGVREKLKLNFLLWTADQTRFELGPALIHSVLPAGGFGATCVSGNLFSGALYLTLD